MSHLGPYQTCAYDKLIVMVNIIFQLFKRKQPTNNQAGDSLQAKEVVDICTLQHRRNQSTYLPVTIAGFVMKDCKRDRKLNLSITYKLVL